MVATVLGLSSWLVDCRVAAVLERFGFLCFAILVVLPWEGLCVALLVLLLAVDTTVGPCEGLLGALRRLVGG
jgi:hypothetical protein